MLWFLKGDTNVRTLIKERNPIWDEWAFEQWVKSEEYTGPDMTNFGLRATKDSEFAEVYKEEMDLFKKRVLEDDEFAEKYADLGPVYGKQWRSWTTGEGSIDQIANLIEGIKNNPDSRRHIVTAWNPSEVEDMAFHLVMHCSNFMFRMANYLANFINAVRIFSLACRSILHRMLFSFI